MQLVITHTGELRPVHIDPHTLDCEEAWRVNRYLTDAQIEYLLDCAAREEKRSGDENLIIDAGGSYPEEDFLQDTIGNLQTIVKGMRASDNKTALLEVVENLEELQSEVNRTVDYGRECLDKIGV